MSSETEAMWQSLAKIALEEQQLYIAERCFAAMGNVARSRYLQETNKLAEEAAKRMVNIAYIYVYGVFLAIKHVENGFQFRMFVCDQKLSRE